MKRNAAHLLSDHQTVFQPCAHVYRSHLRPTLYVRRHTLEYCSDEPRGITKMALALNPKTW